MARMFGEARLVSFDDFTNRILIAGNFVLPVRELGKLLRAALRGIGSVQADKIHLRTVQDVAPVIFPKGGKALKVSCRRRAGR